MTSAQIAIMTTIILYLCLVIFTGVMIGKRSKKSAEGFYLGGRGMGPLVTAMSAEASDMSSYLLMGIPGLAYLSGVADASWTAIGLAIGTYLNFLLVARRLRRYSVELDAITIPSFISKRYGEKKPIIMGIASLIILVFFVPYVASGLAAIGKLFNSLFGWNYMLSVIVGAIVIISYTSVGGFSAVATMDLIQSVIMTVALCVIVVFGIVQAGGMDAVLAHASSLPGFLSFGQTYNAASGQAEPYGLIRIVSMLAWGLGYFGMPHILVRFMAIRHEDELKISRRIASIWVVISMAVAVFIGIVGHAVSNVGRIPMLEGSATETVIVRLSDLLSSYGLLPAIVAGCILAGILAATMSTADSQLLAAASAFSENVLQDVFGVKLTSKQNMLAARLTVVMIAFIAIFLAAVVAVLVWVVLNKTTFGYELKAVGLNKNAARYAGINEKKNIILSMAIAGALAGFGAGLFYLSNVSQWNPLNSTSLPGMGFNGISVALLASSNPIGTVFSALFISHISVGGSFLSTKFYPTEISDLISGIIIYLCAFSMLFRGKIQSLLFRNAEKTNVNAEPAPAAEKTKKEGK